MFSLFEAYIYNIIMSRDLTGPLFWVLGVQYVAISWVLTGHYFVVAIFNIIISDNLLASFFEEPR